MMQFVIFGANGATGRLLTQQALEAGHGVTAVTRNPRDFPIDHPALALAEGDVHDRGATADAMVGADVVLSTLGVPFTRQPVSIYSDGITSIAEAMAKHGITRVVAVSSAGTVPSHHADGGFLLNRVMQPLVTRTIGRTTYADMRAMELFLAETSLDWTVMRPGGLFDTDRVSDYELSPERSERVFTSRADLAAGILAAATSTRWSRQCVAINTVEGAPSLMQMIRKEARG